MDSQSAVDPPVDSRGYSSAIRGSTLASSPCACCTPMPGARRATPV
ncbi:MAG: hypothetical protein IPK27_01090 [Rhodanobacteraceae bacterium]|nr:hypothetical protein [Rhodanobacteraceae bacterium]